MGRLAAKSGRLPSRSYRRRLPGWRVRALPHCGKGHSSPTPRLVKPQSNGQPDEELSVARRGLQPEILAFPVGGAPCCDPDRVGQAEGHARTRLLTASGGARSEVAAEIRGVQGGGTPWRRFLGPPEALGRGLGQEAPSNGGTPVQKTTRLGINSRGSGIKSRGSGIKSRGLGINSRGSGIKSRGLGINSRGSGIKSRGLGINSRGSGIKSRGLGINSRGSGIKSRGLGINSRGSGIKSRGLGINSRGSGIKSRGLGINSRGLGIKSREPGIKVLGPSRDRSGYLCIRSTRSRTLWRCTLSGMRCQAASRRRSSSVRSWSEGAPSRAFQLEKSRNSSAGSTPKAVVQASCRSSGAMPVTSVMMRQSIAGTL